MPKMKKDGYAIISKPVLIRRKNGVIENISGQTVHILDVGFKKCQCDIGLEKPIMIPNTHLEAVA